MHNIVNSRFIILIINDTIRFPIGWRIFEQVDKSKKAKGEKGVKKWELALELIDDAQRQIIIDKLLEQLKAQQSKKRKPRKSLVPVPGSPSPNSNLSSLEPLPATDVSLGDPSSSKNGESSHAKAA